MIFLKTTKNYGLKKPDQTDFYNVDDFNENMDSDDEEMKKNEEIEGFFGDLTIINENSEVTGVQRVKKYQREDSVVPLMLLWLGRNIFADVAFHKAECFISCIKENYLTWNMPFWLYYEKKPQMVNYRNVNFPILKYRVHSANYINSELGLHNVLNGVLRTAI